MHLSPTTAPPACLAVAAGEVWYADADTPLPDALDAPLDGYTYGGPVGVVKGPNTFGYEYPAVSISMDNVLGEDPYEALLGPTIRTTRVLSRRVVAGLEWHAPLALGTFHNRYRSIVVCDRAGLWRFAAARTAIAEGLEHVPHGPRCCVRVHTPMEVYPTDTGERYRMLAHPSLRNPSNLRVDAPE